MKKNIYLLVMLLFTTLTAYSQKKYAVLIIGDLSAQNASIPSSDLWKGSGSGEMDEFWNDTYLMWEMLQSKEFHPDSIFVLFGDGNDRLPDYNRYKPNNVVVTDNSATVDHVKDLFQDLRYGNHGMPQITEDDFLFVWIFDHGGYYDGHSRFYLYNDGIMIDTTFANLVNPIPAHRKAFWMQQCHSGGFADDLTATNTVFISAAQVEQEAHPADDKRLLLDEYGYENYIENESYQNTTYHHGEFDYHMISVINRKTPTNLNYYGDEFYSDFDPNEDGIISMMEAFLWDTIHNSRKTSAGLNYGEMEDAIYDDIGNIGSHMSFEYPTLLFDSISGNESHRGIIGISKDLYVADGQTLTITGNSTVTLCNNARLVIEEGGSLAINGNIRFYGKNDNIIEIHGNFMNNSDTLVFNNLKIQVTSENFFISKAAFYDTELDYDALSSHPNPGIQESGSITVRGCFFSNPHKQFAIRLKNTANFSIQNNAINTSAGNGVYVANSGNTATDNSAVRRISYNTINQCSSAGLVLYASSGDVLMNQIFRNGTGVKLLNNCNINDFNGNCGALLAEDTQFIHDNDSYEIYLTSNCAPQNMHYNVIVDTIGGNTPFIYYDGNVGFGEPPVTSTTVIDVTKNTWSGSFIPSTHLYSTTPNVTYDSLPYWSMGTCSDNGITEGQCLIASADSLRGLGEFALAKNVYHQVVDNYPHTTSAATALKIMLPLESMTGQDYSSLQRYYLTDPAIMSDTILGKLASSLSNKCDEILGNYSKAITWYEDVITNPNTTFCDSIFAAIDLGDLYLKMEDGGEKAIGKLAQFKPNSRAAFEAQCQYALSLLPLSSNGDAPFFGPLDGPFPYWVDTITAQPEGYVVDAEGNVEISSSDGLVWLISAVNGLNGCEPDNFDGRAVRLTDDIDFGAEGWNFCFSPIGTRDTPFLGTFDGAGHRIHHLSQSYSIYDGINNYYFDMGVFGYIRHATVKDVTLDSTCRIHSNCDYPGFYRGGMVGFADSLSIVDNIYIHSTRGAIAHNYGSSVVGMNRNSIVRNCACGGRSYSYSSPEEGAALVAYNRSEGGYADAIVENCYFYGEMGGSYSTQYVACLVCFNETAPDNNGKQAVIRNCHSTPKHDFMGFTAYGTLAAVLSEGSSVNYCYYDPTKMYQYAQMVGLNQGGELVCCSEYININGIGTLALPVTVNGTTTDNLLDALNLWIEEQEHPELYRTWAMVTDSIPVFGGYYVGVHENATGQESINVYPNPTTGLVTITGKDLKQAEVLNMLGQCVATAQGKGETLQIDIANLPVGIYFVRVTDEEGRKCIRKVVKK